jgi:hypothetical protein
MPSKKPTQVQIPYDLLTDLCRYHLAGIDDPELEARIRVGLRAKMDSTAARERYTKNLQKPKDAIL